MRREAGKGPEKKSGTPVILAGLGGFLLGAATVLLVLWIYMEQSPDRSGSFVPAPSPVPAPSAPSQPAPAPPSTAPVPQASPPPPGQLQPPIPSAAPPVPSVQPPAAPPPADLAARNLLLPVQGIRPQQLQDTFNDSRGNGARRHEALDIMAPRGTPVLATEDGRIAKLFTSKQGGLTIYEFDPTVAYAFYYAHLDHYADGLKEGDVVRRGQILGYVGSTGDASPDAPHLHFSIFRLTPEKQWWKGEAINPFGLLR
ncbi:MAG TPA: M23 family metallopeptidase [Thermoanaerobaculia bacterium]|jgi:murein DD-endopeptidase MepM/ murein hydrolase activator NlpD|nr:M23 family metallopeptidase [Thermoanaerobaculia bacterium]